MICFDMRQIEQNNLKKKAAKRSKKIQRCPVMILTRIVIIYLVVLCTEVMGSLGAFFGQSDYEWNGLTSEYEGCFL